jgi:signal transduction histidine kinase
MAAGTRAGDRRPEGARGEDDAPRPLVLVVDDEPQVLRSICAALGRRFRITTATNGEEALSAALAQVPDLILTDLMMPRMTGEQLVHAVRARPELARVPVVLLTGYADEEMRIRLLREGALDYVSKPFSPRELVCRVENLVALKVARELLERELDCRDRDLDAMTRELLARKRELEAALQSAQRERDRAARASEAKSDLLRLVSHELRTPLAALRLVAQQMERDRRVALPPEHGRRVGRILALADRLSAQIDELLEHVGLDRGPADVRADAVDLPALVAEALEPLRAAAEEKALELRVASDPDLPPLRTRRRLLRLVLSSLLDNAVKFTDAGSVCVTLRREDGATRIAVTDTGPGIAAADQPRAFEPFEQLEPLRHKHKPGLGLGLALARQAAVALGARIEVASAQGQGSTFTVVLPDPDDAAERGVSGPPPGAAPTAP